VLLPDFSRGRLVLRGRRGLRFRPPLREARILLRWSVRLVAGTGRVRCAGRDWMDEMTQGSSLNLRP